MRKILVLEGTESIGNLTKELGRVNTARIHHKEELEELDKIAGNLKRKINKAVNAHTIKVQHSLFR
jgi:ArsR family metal-binding transcriptional regulator